MYTMHSAEIVGTVEHIHSALCVGTALYIDIVNMQIMSTVLNVDNVANKVNVDY